MGEWIGNAWDFLRDGVNRDVILFLGGVALAVTAYFSRDIPQLLRAWKGRRQSKGASTPVIPGAREITLYLGSVDPPLEVHVQRMRKCRPGETSIDGLKEDESALVLMERDGGYFRIGGRQLEAAGFQDGDPFKFFCRIPAEQPFIDRCYVALCRNEHIVTGKGKVDPADTRFHQVWFVSGKEPTYPNPNSLYYVNNRFKAGN